jgi:hypothetical protein
MRFGPAICITASLVLVGGVASAHHALKPAGATQTPSQRSGVLSEIERVSRNVRSTRYSHSTHIDERAGRYDFDCSAMATFLLAHGAPHARDAVLRENGHGRPVARDFHDVISQASVGRSRNGWMRIAHVADLRPGDVIAWRRPPSLASSNTGHVAFVYSTPKRLDREGRRYLVRVVDSTSIPHGDDSRSHEHTSGFGFGNIVLFTEKPGEDPTAYGWYGLPTRIDFRTHIALGRAVD